MVDFCHPQPGSSLAGPTRVKPAQCSTDFPLVLTLHQEFWGGQLSIKGLLDKAGCRTLCMLAPEGSKSIPVWLGLLQERLLEAHQDPNLKAREGDPSWELALLMNVHRVPLNEQNLPDVLFGLTMSYNTPFLDPVLFPFLSEVRVCDPPLAAQFQARQTLAGSKLLLPSGTAWSQLPV